MSLTRPLTRSLTRALSNSELTQKLGGGFSIFALNPYLLFDARDSMIGTLENPTLDLNPALPETLDVITATRAGVATFTDANGLIASAPANTVRVDQTQGAELTPTVFQHFSQTDFSNSYWSKRNGTITSGFSSPDGGNNAFKLVASQSDGDVFASAASGNSHTKVVSVFAKANSATSKLRIQEQNYTGKRTEFDLNLGTITYSNSSGTSTIENIGDGWYRCAHVETYSSGQGTVAFAFRSVTADSLFLFGPQVEEGTTATTFVPNTTGSPKFITGPTFGPRVPMILVEPSAINLVTYSEDFSNAAWTKFGGGTGIAPVVTPDFGTSPDGTVSASRVQFNKGTGTTVGDQSTIFDAEATSSGATTSKSIYLKSNTNEAYEMVIYEVTNASGTNVKKITVTPDWQRFDVYGAVSSTTTGIAIGLREINVSGLSNTADVLVWGAQLETGSVATSYIPTSGSTVTRAADDLVISGSDFSDFYNASEGTVYTEAVGRGYFDFNSVFAISNNTFNESIYQRTPSNNQVLVVIDGGNVQASLGSSTTPTGTLVRRAASFKLNNFKGSHDGVDTNSDTSGTIPTVDRLHIGASASAANKLNGHIKRLIVWPLHSDSL